MKKRSKMSRKKSAKNFRKGQRVNTRNGGSLSQNAMRGGVRL